jgi:hypothetical protein
MWYPMTGRFRNAAVLLFVLAVGLSLPAKAAVLDVCATCTHTTLDSAFAAAATGDTIILDGPDAEADPAETYTISAGLVVDDTKSGLEIRGKTAARPDKIRISLSGTGPVITVEEDAALKLLGVTITGGTTGILAMQNSDVDIRRCLIEGIAGIGVDCTNPERVYIAGSVITACTGDGVRLSSGGVLEMTQCTLLANGGLGVNAVSGLATVASCLIHDCGAGLDGTATSLTVGGNWVTDAAGNPLPMPTGVVDAYPLTDILDPLVTFEQDAAENPFPGDIDTLFALPLTGETAETISDVPPLARDFSNVSRSTTNPRPGADENGIAATAAAWVTCEIVQRGTVREWVGEGPATIYLVVENIDLVNSLLWIANPTQTGGITVDNTTTPNRIGGIAVVTPSQVDGNYGYVDYTFDRDVFVTGFPNLTSVDVTDYEIYIQPDGVLLNDTDVLDQPEAAGSQAEVGRIFGLDTLPPTIREVGVLADQYLVAPPGDGGVINAGGPGGWGTGLLANEVGANFGRLAAPGVEAHVFFDGSIAYAPGLVVNPLSFSIRVTFDDAGSGFATTGLPSALTVSTTADKEATLYEDYNGARVPGFAWWGRNSESDAELLPAGAPDLTVTYDNPSGNALTATWTFTNALYTANQWHAIANLRVMDLAGNEITINPSSQTVVPLRPLHLWRFPIAQAVFRDGPSNRLDSNPIFTWALNRFGGQDPSDPAPCIPSVQYFVYKLDPTGTFWLDISGGWSVWQDPNNRVISLDSPFSGAARLRDVIAAAGGQPNSQYMMVLRGYDEAGNLQTYLDGSAIPAIPNPIDAMNNLGWIVWGDPGPSVAAGLDTKVQANFWHNNRTTGGDNRAVDLGERTFGSASRIPLPVECPPRVEAGFNITMQSNDGTATGDLRVGFSLYEDGQFVASGLIDPTSVASGYTFVVPQDLIVPRPVRLVLYSGGTGFLNASDCGTVDRLGDDGPVNAEPPFRQRDVKYQLVLRTGRFAGTVSTDRDVPGNYFFDTTPATVEFTVTVDRALKDEQPNKSFSKE